MIGGRPRPGRAVLALVAVAVAVALAGALPLAAAEVRRGAEVTVPAGETADEDRYVLGRRVRVQGASGHDLVGVAGLLVAEGPVVGNLDVVAARAEARGAVGRSVRAAGASIAVYGRVAGDVVAVGGSVTLVEGARVGGDVVALGGDVRVVAGAAIAGDLRVTAARVTVEGRVGGDLRAVAGRIVLAPGARVDGALRYASPRAARVDPTATVRGATVREDPGARLPWGHVLLWRAAALPRLLALLALGTAAVGLAPRRAAAVADRLRAHPAGAGGAGLAVVLFAPLLLVVVAATLVGLPLALLGAGAYLVALYGSGAVVALALGRVLLRVPPGDAARPRALAALALGLVAVAALRLVPLPHAAPAVAAVAAVFGVGALALGLPLGRRA